MSNSTGKNIGFVGTRFAGTDGVSLEAAKWAKVLRESGHKNHWFAGLLGKQRMNLRRFTVSNGVADYGVTVGHIGWAALVAIDKYRRHHNR